MTFPHEDPEFGALLRTIAVERRLSVGLVEKDYWIVHTLWALHQGDFGVWFKGGTSLSKAFSLVPRFSEDLDLRIDSEAAGVSKLGNWGSKKKPQISARQKYFRDLLPLIVVPDATVTLAELDDQGRGADYEVAYPGAFKASIAPPNSAFVRLEVGRARVAPFVACDLESFVHEHLKRIGQLGNYTDNRPRGVRCVHPQVTLIEKLDAIAFRVGAGREPETFIRHYEDAARIIAEEGRLPALGQDIVELTEEMAPDLRLGRIAPADHRGFSAVFAKDEALSRAYDAIAPMFWAPRISLDEACDRIRGWLTRNFPET